MTNEQRDFIKETLLEYYEYCIEYGVSYSKFFDDINVILNVFKVEVGDKLWNFTLVLLDNYRKYEEGSKYE